MYIEERRSRGGCHGYMACHFLGPTDLRPRTGCLTSDFKCIRTSDMNQKRTMSIFGSLLLLNYI